jgi:DNA polymerase-3 subunit delta
MPLEQAAAEVGLRDWQLRKARQQLTGWSPDAVARALRALAEADANVKGAAVDAEYAIELMIIKLGRARRAG